MTNAALPEHQLTTRASTVGFWIARPDQDEPDHIDLDAPYQRGSVWTLDQRRNLIRSLYSGIPIGSVIISLLPYDPSHPFSYRVVDGKQRVETVRAWVNNEFTVPGWWFRPEDLDEDLRSGDVTHSQLTLRGQRFFTMSANMPALELNAKKEYLGRDDDGNSRWRDRSAAEILDVEKTLYLLINESGTAHTAEELDRARTTTDQGAL